MILSMNIRRAIHSDVPAIIATHVTSIRELNSKDYSPEQIAAWIDKTFKPRLWEQTIDRDLVWILEISGKIVGYGHMALMDSHRAEILGLYFHPAATRMGAGTELYLTMQDHAVTLGIKEIQLFSTLTAKNFYESVGFQQIDGAQEISVRGRIIQGVPMSTILA